MAFAFLGNSPLQKWGIPACNFEEFYLAENTMLPGHAISHNRLFAVIAPIHPPVTVVAAFDKTMLQQRAAPDMETVVVPAPAKKTHFPHSGVAPNINAMIGHVHHGSAFQQTGPVHAINALLAVGISRTPVLVTESLT
jgi:hypothetical protein